MLLNNIYSASQVNNFDALKKYVELLVKIFLFFDERGLTFLEP